MRDLIDTINNLNEDSTLSPTTIKKREGRFQRFIDMIRNEEEFYYLDSKTGERDPFIADPAEADRFEKLDAEGKFTGQLSLRSLSSGEMIPLNKILKTAELGGQASKGEEGEEISKEAALLKPSQIGITNYPIEASDLGEVIISNSVLQSTDYGRLVIQMAETIMQGGSPTIPKETPQKLTKAIVDYAGEYLGVLALTLGKTRFPRREGFEKWLGATVSDLTIVFPAESNMPLADSFATITNSKTKHTVNISSKGTGGGAPPAVSNLKIPDSLKNDPDFEQAIKFIEICQNNSTVAQVFAAMNLLYEYDPSSVPQSFHQFLPWNVSEMAGLVSSNIKKFKNRQEEPLPEYHDLFKVANFKGKSADGGRLAYVTKKAVMEAVNEGKAIPNFQEAVLLILDMNFVQQYADLETKSRILKFSTQWPAKLDGKVSLMSKAGADDPTKGSFSFKLANTDPKTELPMPGEEAGTDDIDPAFSDMAKLSKQIALGMKDEPDDEPRQVGNVGRNKRR